MKPPALLSWVLLNVLASTALAKDADILVIGEQAADNRTVFIWTVVNKGEEPITMFRAPHYLGKRLTLPEGWEETKMTGNIRLGHTQKPGMFECAATDKIYAIRQGSGKRFLLNLDQVQEWTVAEQAVTVGLADGSEVVIGGVACPSREAYLRRNLPLIGLGTIFAVFLLIKVLRGGAKRPAPSAPGPHPGEHDAESS